MRTVHETEALRPSDPIPKSQQAGAALGKSSKLKIVLKNSQGANASGQDELGDDSLDGDDYSADLFTQLTEEQGFSKKELTMPLERLHALCRMQVKWAEREDENLRKEWKHWEELYRQEWLEKEILLDQVIKSELDWSDRRRAVLSGRADVQIRNGAPNGAARAKVSGEPATAWDDTTSSHKVETPGTGKD
jgi:ABC-type amino acid transport substrate-binding protein